MLNDLSELRQEWEEGAIKTVIFDLSDELVEISMVVLIQFPEYYALHRYFVIADTWNVSVDYRGDDIWAALALVAPVK